MHSGRGLDNGIRTIIMGVHYVAVLVDVSVVFLSHDTCDQISHKIETKASWK